MINKLLFLTKTSINKKAKSKWFLVANIILLIAIIGLVNVDSIIKFFGGDFDDTTKILVVDNTNVTYDNLYNNYLEYQKIIENINDTKMEKYDGNIESAKDIVIEEDAILLEINNDENNFIKATVTTKGKIDAIILQSLTSTLTSVKTNLALNHYNISSEMMDLINSKVEVERVKLDDSKSNDEMMDLVMGVAFPIIILPFFMLTIFLIQMIGAEINEEKTTKGMEIIISNVPAKVHFASKLISSNLFVIMQSLILVIDVFVAVILRMFTGNGSISNIVESLELTNVLSSLGESVFLDSLSYVIPITIILMLLTFVAYSLLAGILASMTTNLEDFQQLQTPIIIISLLGYYLAMMASMFEGSIFIKIVSYLPFISALLAPALLLLGQIGVFDVVIAIFLLVLTIYLLYKYGLKIYKVGILNYSSTGLWKKMFKAIKS